jgi:hypothetical protein
MLLKVKPPARKIYALEGKTKIGLKGAFLKSLILLGSALHSLGLNDMGLREKVASCR